MWNELLEIAGEGAHNHEIKHDVEDDPEGGAEDGTENSVNNEGYSGGNQEIHRASPSYRDVEEHKNSLNVHYAPKHSRPNFACHLNCVNISLLLRSSSHSSRIQADVHDFMRA